MMFFSREIRSKGCLLLLAVIMSAVQFSPLGTGYAVTTASYVMEQASPSMALVYSIIDYEGTFYVPWPSGTENYTVTHYIAAMGSGFFVDPNGSLVTNGHIVFCLSQKDYAEDPYTRDYIIRDASATLVDLYRELTQEDVQIIYDYNRQRAVIGHMSRSTYVIPGEAEGDVIKYRSGLSATVVNADPFLGRDLAILKVELSNTPSLLIGDSDDLEMGDEVYAIGYPGVAAFKPQLSSAALLVPYVTQGVVSDKRPTRQGTSSIQHSASTNHGYCGGPLLDGNGAVVGVNDVGSINELGLEPATSDFAVASNVLRDFLGENGVTNYLGNATVQYRRGLAYYFARMYDSAKEQFDAAAALFPYDTKAGQLSQECQSAISRGERAESSLTLSAVPLTVKARSGAITVNGALQHASEMPMAFELSWPAIQVTVQYIRPDGSSVTHTVTNSDDGTFTDTYTPDASGQWSVKASWAGDEDHGGAMSEALAFTVTETSLIEMMTNTGIIYAIPVAAVAIVAIFVMRKRKAAGPLSPSP